ncbi:hypothetical protein Mgra_00004774 [Meloidogyne graminicola]|uniref:Innexin n=1 Tax=Meloidogyne graminicola TaxID=189291 RepID=A0A8S9ZRJ7_9BILA|nr:hypothetical protein Mgra_00004774 [Meloidogyne graminicola]
MGFIHFLSIGVALITLINQFYIEGMSAPKYLSIEGWKECVESDPIETYEVYCLPKVKKQNCSKNAWKQLKVSKNILNIINLIFINLFK